MKQKFLGAAVCLALSGVVGAVELDSRASLGLQYARLEETGVSGNHLLTERGDQQPAFALQAQARWAAFSLLLAGRREQGVLTYDGQTQGGAGVDAKSDYRTSRLSVLAGAGISSDWEWLLGVEREWRARSIRGTTGVAGLDEYYRFTWVASGPRWQRSTAAGNAEVSALLLWGLSGSQTAESPGIIDRAAIDSGRLRGLRLEAVLPLWAGHGVQLGLQPRVEYFKIKRSEDVIWTRNGVAQGTLAQPETRRWSAGVELTLGW